MTEFQIEINLEDDEVEGVDEILSYLQNVVSFTQQQLRERHPGLLSHFRNGVASLPFLIKDDDEASHEGESSEEDHLDWQTSAPHLKCSSELQWVKFPDLIAEAVK